MFNWSQLQEECSQWANATFGDRQGNPLGAIHHLEREVKELKENPFDATEQADIMMLLLDILSIQGRDMNDLYFDVWDKLQLNKRRKWGKPDIHGVVEHIEEG